MADYRTIEVDTKNGITIVRLNRPAVLNALTEEMVAELITVLDDIRDNNAARALLITGNGRAFSSGADLVVNTVAPDGQALDAGRVLERDFNPLMERMAKLPVPIVAAVNGMAVGAGCSLALAADLVLAAKSSYFLLAFVNVGVVPDGGVTWLLPRLIGSARAKAMMMLGERVPAEQAELWGLIYKAVDSENLLEKSMEYATRFANGPPRAYALIRQGLHRSLQSSMSDTLLMEREHQLIAGRTADFAEGVAAFQEKRPPRFTGK